MAPRAAVTAVNDIVPDNQSGTTYQNGTSDSLLSLRLTCDYGRIVMAHRFDRFL
jgi:hypothetical protein